MRTGAPPVAGQDYPGTYQQFLQWFGEEAACRRYLLQCRWPDGFACPRCGKKTEPWTTARGYLHCRLCGGEVSATAGTIFEGTRISLRTWFSTIWLVTSQKDGASALGLKRVLGLGSYQTAWAWLHKLRRAMVRPGRDRLGGRIEVDETYVGGSQKAGQRERGAERRQIVLIALELHWPKGFGRVRMRRVPDVAGSSLVPFICEVAQKGSQILTDGWRGYNGLEDYGYVHKRVVVSDTGDPAHVSLPGIHRLAALLKRWLLSTHQGSVSSKHLDYYLDEYTFRFNRRASRSRGLLFYRLMQQAVATGPSSCRQIVGHDPKL
ncbi:MAG TPA: IS1595 family transposase [Candidatus Paceibacterota bacterium]|nr:IS1595 family transposase [Verrucomicrobiota bacterium]HOX01672.1 IS1595 family transposase [Verrucomicrobiota bacterium]HRZ43894.1 IS1595 family transposase [Candidatus Paceibacterota bacterium]HRZ92063.1 IS1595 family transposase [Candidatus Paceibacterota bacterium]